MLTIPESFGDGGSGLSRGQKVSIDGEPKYLYDVLVELQGEVTTTQTNVTTLQNSLHATPVTLAAALALGASARAGLLYVTSTLFGFGLFQWSATSTINDSTGQIAIRPTGIDSGDPGRWDRVDQSFSLYVEHDFTLADDAVLYTVPTGVRLQIISRPFATVTQSYVSAGGATLGLSSSNAAYNADGDLFGGAAGSAAAALAAGIRAGTIGTVIDSQGIVVLVGADTILGNLLTSTFEAGAAKFAIPVMRV